MNTKQTADLLRELVATHYVERLSGASADSRPPMPPSQADKIEMLFAALAAAREIAPQTRMSEAGKAEMRRLLEPLLPFAGLPVPRKPGVTKREAPLVRVLTPEEQVEMETRAREQRELADRIAKQIRLRPHISRKVLWPNDLSEEVRAEQAAKRAGSP